MTRSSLAPKLWIPALWAALIAAPACLAVFKYAKAGLNADIILNQIMALQHVTLFYWGQNRLLNILPFILQPVSWPLANLFLVLFVASAAFFCLLWLSAFLAAKLQGQANPAKTLPLAFLLNVCLCVAFFKHDAWVSLCLWHFEYSISMLLGAINFYVFFNCAKLWACLASLGGFLALGLNPSLLLLLWPGLCLKCFHKWRISKKDALLGCLWLFFFLIWWLIAKSYGSFDDYSAILPGMFGIGMENSAINILREYLLAGRMIFAFFILLCALAIHYKSAKAIAGADIFQKQLSIYTLITGIFAAAIIACIRWCHMNDFGARYFIFSIYLAIFIFSIWSAHLLAAVRRGKTLAAFFLAIAVMFFLYPKSFNLQKTDIYQTCDEIAPAGGRLYAGDYWKVWACVSRDLNNNHKSYAMCYRADADKGRIMERTEKELAKTGSITVFCLDAATPQCLRQIHQYWPNLTPVSIAKVNGRNFELRLEPGGLGEGLSQAPKEN